MNYIDIVIILIFLLGAVVGYKRGAIQQAISFFGFIIVVVLAFLLKNPVSYYLYTNLPFFNFSGILSGITVINILVYEVVAFFAVFGVLYLILRIIGLFSKLLDKLLSSTILLSVPFKIVGALLGVIENYFVAFLVLYILSLPFFNIEILKESKLRNDILDKTPILNKYVEGTVKVGREFWNVAEKYTSEYDSDKLNLETLDLMLKYKVTDVKSIDILVDKNKIQINNIESVLMKYRDE